MIKETEECNRYKRETLVCDQTMWLAYLACNRTGFLGKEAKQNRVTERIKNGWIY